MHTHMQAERKTSTHTKRATASTEWKQHQETIKQHTQQSQAPSTNDHRSPYRLSSYAIRIRTTPPSVLREKIRVAAHRKLIQSPRTLSLALPKTGMHQSEIKEEQA